MKICHACGLCKLDVAYRERLSKLRSIGDPIFFRVTELAALPEALQLARQFAELSRQSVKGWASSKPWINATETDDLLAEVRFLLTCMHSILA